MGSKKKARTEMFETSKTILDLIGMLWNQYRAEERRQHEISLHVFEIRDDEGPCTTFFDPGDELRNEIRKVIGEQHG